MNRFSILAVSSALLFTAFGCRQNVQTNTNSVNAPLGQVVTNTSVRTNPPASPVTPLPRTAPDVLALQRLALLFAERYGSYSNQSNFANLEGLYPFMTERFAQQTQTSVAAERARERDTSVYFGVSTKALTVATIAFQERDGTALFNVTTLRTESVATTRNSRQYQQTLHITFLRSGTLWRVDQAAWEPR